MQLKGFKIAFFLLALFVFTYEANAQEPCGFIYVTTDGIGSAQGTKTDPANLPRAVQLANTTSRKYIKVQSGTYNVNQSLEINSSNVTLEGGYDGQWNKTSINTNTVLNLRPQLESATVTGILVRHVIGIKVINATGVSIRDMVVNVLNDNIGTNTNRRGHSIYGLYLQNSGSFHSSRITLNTGNATNGAPPPGAANGSNGTSGNCGTRGDCDKARAEGHGGIGGIGAGNSAGAAGGGAISNLWDNSGCTRVTGVAGSNGAAGQNLRAGGNGGGGASGGRRGPGSSTPGNGGVGGNGGAGGGGGTGGTTGGGGGIADCANGGCPSTTNLGDHGRRGANGANGANGTPNYNVSVQFVNGNFNTLYIPVLGLNGGDGSGGGGGKGGGGGGGENNDLFTCGDGSGNNCASLDGSGAGGGGGGGGGQGGQGAQGGGAGGSAFAVYSMNSPGYNFVQTSLNPGNAGSGTSGATGGQGGLGALGGFGARVTNNHGSRPTFQSCDVDWNYSGICASDGCSSGETGAGGAGGRGGNGGNGGNGQGGTNGVSRQHHDVSVGIVNSSSSIPTFPVDMVAAINKGCTNSEIPLSKTTLGNWSFGQNGSFSLNLDSLSTTYTAFQNSVQIFYTSTGLKNISIGNNQYLAFIEIIENRLLPQIQISATAICAGQQINLSTSTSGVEYQWEVQALPATTPSNPAPVYTSNQQNPGNLTISAPGTYHVRLKVRDACCGWSIPVYRMITVLPLPQVFNITGGGAFCDNENGVDVGLNNSQSGVTYQLQLNGNPLESPLNGTGNPLNFGLQTQAGTYTVHATAPGNCSAAMSGNASVIINPAPQMFNLTGGGNICVNDLSDILLSGSQIGIEYQLYLNANPLGQTVSGTGNPLSFGQFNTQGNYTAIATAPGTACSYPMNNIVEIDFLPQPQVFNVSGGGDFCFGQTGMPVLLDTSATGIVYQLTLNGNSVGNAFPGTGNSINFGIQTVSGTYSVIATTADNCTEQQFNTVQITEVSVIEDNLISQNDTICVNQTPDLITGNTPSGGTGTYSYQWQSSVNGIVFTNLTGSNAEDYQAGVLTETTWYRRIVVSGPCADTSNVVQLTVQPGIDNNIIVTAQLICYNTIPDLLIGSVPTGGDGSFTYQWQISTDGANFTEISNASDPDYQPGQLTATRYFRRVVFSGQCVSNSNIIAVQVNNELILNQAIVGDVSCYDGSNGSITISVSGGTTPYQYAWDNGLTGASISSLTAGNYEVIISDGIGCSSSETITVNQPDSIQIFSSIVDATCNIFNDGSISIDTVTGGTLPYTFSWSTGSSQNNISGLSTGVYWVTITDSKGCFKIRPFEIFAPEPPVINFSIQNISCTDESDGELTATISGGASPYQLEWSTGSNVNTISGLAEGWYEITVTDANFCPVSDSLFLANPPMIEISFDSTPLNCVGVTDASLFANVTGGTGDYTYIWNTGEETQGIYDLGSGFYSITVTDENGCVLSHGVAFVEPPLFSISLPSDTVIAKGTEIILNVSVDMGSSNLSYVWEPADYLSTPFSGNPIANPPSSITYTVTATDPNGCVADASIFIHVSSQLYAFPNGFVVDGFNNTFYVLKDPVVEVLEFMVFNRWGQIIHNDPATGWNGYFNDDRQPLDTYVYRAVLRMPDGEIRNEHGSFTLIR